VGTTGIVLANLVAVALWVAHPHLSAARYRARGGSGLTPFLTWTVCQKAFRHPELSWQVLKAIDQAEARRALARRAERQRRTVAAVDRFLGQGGRAVPQVGQRQVA
jgi:hypothetical protein